MTLKCYEHCCSSCIALVNVGKTEGIIPILHGPQACTFGNQIGSMFCRPSRLLTVGTTLHKSEVIFGGEENLRQQIINVYNEYKPNIILVISTCVPQLIGEDVSGVLTELKDELPGLKLAFCQTGFNHHFATPRGSDVSWKAVVEVLDPQDKVKNSVGLMGRAGQDADSLGVLTSFIREAGITAYAFPAGHLDEMAKIVKAEYLCPIQLVPYQTCKTLQKRFDSKIEFTELPVGILGTSNYLRGIAKLTSSQKLEDIVTREKKRVMPRLEKIKARFEKKKPKVLLVTGPSNELTMAKILAEFGAEVLVVPSMRNKFAKQEQELLKARYKDRFIVREDDYDTILQLVDEFNPDVVFCDFQARVEITPRLIPVLINENYLNEYGYDYALDFGENFFKNLKSPVFDEWQSMMDQYAGGSHVSE